MNLLAYWSVLSSQRKVVFVGIVLSLAIAFLALFRPTSSGIELRSPRTFVAESTLFVTQSGFPWGRTALDEYLAPKGAREGVMAVPRFADPGRMEYLTALYAELAESGVVRSSLESRYGSEVVYDVTPLGADVGAVLPLINVAAYATSPDRAIALSNRVGQALRSYVQQNQTANNVPAKTRVEVNVAAPAKEAEVFEGVRLTPALMLFILGMTVTVLVAFTRHNVALAREQSGEAAPQEVPNTVELSERRVAAGGAGRATRYVATAGLEADLDSSVSARSTAGSGGHMVPGDEEDASQSTRPPGDRWKPRI